MEAYQVEPAKEPIKAMKEAESQLLPKTRFDPNCADPDCAHYSILIR